MQWIGTRAVMVTALLLAAFWPGQDVRSVHGWLADMSAGQRRAVVCAVLAALFAMALVAAAFGPVGLAVYFGLIVLLVR